MNSKAPRSPLASCVALLIVSLAALPLSAQTPGTRNRDGRFVNLEEAPIHPMEFSSNGLQLWALNMPDARVSVFGIDPQLGLQLLQEIPVGLGPVTIRKR